MLKLNAGQIAQMWDQLRRDYGMTPRLPSECYCTTFPVQVRSSLMLILVDKPKDPNIEQHLSSIAWIKRQPVERRRPAIQYICDVVCILDPEKAELCISLFAELPVEVLRPFMPVAA